MIDEQWLKSLSFDATGGARVTGLLALGGENIVFKASLPDKSQVVMKVRRNHLGFHIKELPLFLTDKPLYDVTRLNQKLYRLVGNQLLDSMTHEYDRLYGSMIKILHEHGIGGVIFGTLTPESVDTIPFILSTPGMKRRLDDIASLAGEKGGVSELVTVNTAEWPIHGLRSLLSKWAREMLATIERLQGTSADLQPATLADNPLYVWGAAVMDGFFTDEELPAAVQFIQTKFGTLSRHDRVAILMEQASAIAHLLAQFLKESDVTRFVQFCAMNGLAFDVVNREGKVVASGLKYLAGRR